MIDQQGEMLIPSKLREPGDRHEQVQKRISVVRQQVENRGLNVPDLLKDDEHYWFTVLQQYHSVQNDLKDIISDKDSLRTKSFLIAIKQAAELINVQQESAVDGLTKAWSRKSLNNFLENLRRKPRIKDQKIESEVGFLMIDIDYFKRFNDTKGHQEGDRILKETVAVIQDEVRGIDMVARYGGEEFSIVLVGIPNKDIVAKKAEEVRKAIQTKLGITVSIGTTIIMPKDESISDIYSRADANLYKAKQAGRNQVYNDQDNVTKRIENAPQEQAPIVV